MTTTPTTVEGHALIDDGAVAHVGGFAPTEQTTQYYTGGCECGERPEGFVEMSPKAMQRWHRAHLREVSA